MTCPFAMLQLRDVSLSEMIFVQVLPKRRELTFLALLFSCLFVASVMGFLKSSSILRGVEADIGPAGKTDDEELIVVELRFLVGVKSISIG